MRPIDADALKFRDVKVTTNEIDIFGFGGYLTKQCKGILQEEIWNTPTIDAAPKWIPCEDRLPETTDAVLTTYIVNGDRRRRYVEESSYYVDDGSWSSPWDEYRIAGTRIEVIAWMPLPEPYVGERKDDEER